MLTVLYLYTKNYLQYLYIIFLYCSTSFFKLLIVIYSFALCALIGPVPNIYLFFVLIKLASVINCVFKIFSSAFEKGFILFNILYLHLYFWERLEILFNTRSVCSSLITLKSISATQLFGTIFMLLPPSILSMFHSLCHY